MDLNPRKPGAEHLPRRKFTLAVISPGCRRICECIASLKRSRMIFQFLCARCESARQGQWAPDLARSYSRETADDERRADRLEHIYGMRR